MMIDDSQLEFAREEGLRRFRAVLPEVQAQALPGVRGFTRRDEANAIVAFALRNGHIETLHTGVAGFSDESMKKLMIETSGNLTALLFLRDCEPATHEMLMLALGDTWCRGWERQEVKYTLHAPETIQCGNCGAGLRTAWSFCPACGAEQH
jgi:hypothetical protein